MNREYIKQLSSCQKKGIKIRNRLIDRNLACLESTGIIVESLEKTVFQRKLLFGDKGYNFEFFSQKHKKFVPLCHKEKYTRASIPFKYESIFGTS